MLVAEYLAQMSDSLLFWPFFGDDAADSVESVAPIGDLPAIGCGLPAIGGLLAISTETPGERRRLLCCSLIGLETLSSKGKLGKLRECVNRKECRKFDLPWLPTLDALVLFFPFMGDDEGPVLSGTATESFFFGALGIDDVRRGQMQPVFRVRLFTVKEPTLGC